MFFIEKGDVGIGFSYYINDIIEQKKIHITHVFQQKDYIGDYYMLFNKKAEFYYEARTDVHSFALDKKNLINILQTYCPYSVF